MSESNGHGRIQTTLGALAQADGALRRVSALEVDAKTRYHLAKLGRLVAVEVKAFGDLRDAIMADLGLAHGQKADDVPAATWRELQRRSRELTDVPCEVAWGPVHSAALPKASAADLIELGPLLVLDEPSEA